MQSAIEEHYASGSLWERLQTALRNDGVNPAHPTLEQLAPYDQFHGRGIEATIEIADALQIAPNDQILDVGSGLGGPARYIASRFNCEVTGIDLTAEFCEVAKRLNHVMGLAHKVTIKNASALSLPFAPATFDGAYSMNVSMNIQDKAALYRELHRVLRPHAWLVLSEITKGANEGLEYPTPWARTADSSFLVSAVETCATLEQNGFAVEHCHDTLAQTQAAAERARTMVERGEQPPHRAVGLVHQDIAGAAAANSGRGMQAGCIVPVEIRCRRLPDDEHE